MMKLFASCNDKKGFTMVELLLVIAILGILTAIAVPTYLGQRSKAMRKEAEINLTLIRTLEEQYYADNGRYAPNPDGNMYYTQSNTNIQTFLPKFQPGAATTLKFDYSVISNTTGAGFIAYAKGKGNTPIANSCLTLNQANTWGGSGCP